MMDTRSLKSEPEDLSVRDEKEETIIRDEKGTMIRLSGNRQINLEEGAQAIQVNHAVCTYSPWKHYHSLIEAPQTCMLWAVLRSWVFEQEPKQLHFLFGSDSGSS